MIWLNNRILLVYAFTVFAFVVFFFVTNQQTLKDEVMINYIKEIQIQKKLLDSTLTTQEIIKEHARYWKDGLTVTKDTMEKPTNWPMAEVINFIKLIQQQLSYINQTIQSLKEWGEYKDHNRKLRENLKLSSLKLHSFPHVIHENITLDCKTEYDVIILVTSFARNFERRAWIRKTWGSSQTWLNKNNWKVIFNVGAVKSDSIIVNKQLKNESMEFNDLLILDIPEDFHKLSEKVMAALQWVYQKSSFKFVFKVDDDIFVHIDRVIRHTGDSWSNENFVGNAIRGQPPERNKGRYQVTMEEWKWETFDPYCSGGGYILSNSIISKMIPHFNWVKPLKIDDAYIGHLVKLAGGEPLHVPNKFMMWNNDCEFNDDLLVSHPVKKDDCREFLMAKLFIEMGKVEQEGHKFDNVTSLVQYKEAKKKKA